MSANKSKYYIDQREMFQEVLESKRQGKMTNRLAEMCILLSERYSNHYNFSRYVNLKEDLIAAGALACSYGYSKFTPYRDKSKVWDGEEVEYHYLTCYSPFPYLITCIKNSFRALLKSEYNEKNIINESKIENGMEPDHAYVDAMKKKESK